MATLVTLVFLACILMAILPMLMIIMIIGCLVDSCTAFLELHAHCSEWLFSFKFDNLRDRQIGKI